MAARQRLEMLGEGAAEIPPLRVFQAISPGLFRTIGARLVAGRDYAWTVYDRRPFVIVSGLPGLGQAGQARQLVRDPAMDLLR